MLHFKECHLYWIIFSRYKCRVKHVWISSRLFENFPLVRFFLLIRVCTCVPSQWILMSKKNKLSWRFEDPLFVTAGLQFLILKDFLHNTALFSSTSNMCFFYHTGDHSNQCPAGFELDSSGPYCTGNDVTSLIWNQAAVSSFLLFRAPVRSVHIPGSRSCHQQTGVGPQLRSSSRQPSIGIVMQSGTAEQLCNGALCEERDERWQPREQPTENQLLLG